MKKKRSIAQQAASARRKLKTKGVEFLTDYKGNDVPIDYVPNIDLLEHFITLETLQKAKELKASLAEFKHNIQTDGDSLHLQRLKEGGVNNKEVKNYSLTTFDRKEKVEIKRPPKYTMDETELAICREYKKKWIADESGQATPYLIEMVTELIETKDGDIDRDQIGTLNKMVDKVKNKNFTKMVKHFNNSMEPYYAKRYERFIYRDGQGKEQTIVLTYASLHPQAPAEE